MLTKFIFLFLSMVSTPGLASVNSNKFEDKLTLTVSKAAIVLPNTLSADQGQTCMSDDVTGPRIRLRSTLSWHGPGNLIPSMIQIVFHDDKLTSDYVGTISPESAQNRSIAMIYGVFSDYIPPGRKVYETTQCLLDFGKLPFPQQELKGNSQIKVPAKVILTGFVRRQDGKEVPIKKELETEVNYVAGSVPVN